MSSVTTDRPDTPTDRVNWSDAGKCRGSSLVGGYVEFPCGRREHTRAIAVERYNVVGTNDRCNALGGRWKSAHPPGRWPHIAERDSSWDGRGTVTPERYPRGAAVAGFRPVVGGGRDGGSVLRRPSRQRDQELFIDRPERCHP